jgi:hypothetical protein
MINVKISEEITLTNPDETTKKAVYADIRNSSTNAILKCLETGNSASELNHAIIAVTLHGSEDQYWFAHDVVEKFANHNDEWVRAIAILGIGHIKRAHGKVEIDRALPLLKIALQDQSEVVLEYAEDSVGAICNYHNQKKIFLYLKDVINPKSDLYTSLGYSTRTKTHKQKLATIKNREQEIEHCCKKMKHAIKESKGEVIDYDMVRRDYSITIKPCAYDVKFCPFCGKATKKTLTDELSDTLSKEYRISSPDFIEYSNIPDEFLTDEWWIKRGL